MDNNECKLMKNKFSKLLFLVNYLVDVIDLIINFKIGVWWYEYCFKNEVE